MSSTSRTPPTQPETQAGPRPRRDREEGGPIPFTSAARDRAAATDEAFDALADLFLGEADPLDGPFVEREREADRGASVEGARERERRSTRRDRLDEETAATGVAARPEPEREPEPRADEPASMVELVVLGHLPVRSGVWVGPYAAAVAGEEARPVGLVRLVSGQASVEVLGLSDADRSAEADRGTESSVDGALVRAAGRVRRWVVQVDEPEEPGLVASGSVDAVTVLAGANQAAMVDAYRAIKGIVGGRPVSASVAEEAGEGSAGTAVRIAVMGAPADRAVEVAEKLRGAAGVFLSEPIEAGPSVQRVGPTGAAVLFRGAGAMDAEELIDAVAVASALDEPESPEEPSASAWLGRGGAVEPESLRFPERSASAGGAVGAWRNTLRRDDASEALHSAPGADDREAGGRDEGVEVDLASLVEGVEELEVPYPNDDLVRFGRDAAGRLHVLRTDDDGEGLHALTAAGAWARRHAGLLRMALGADVGGSGEPVLHLFVDEPRSVRPLLDADVRLHLLAPIDREQTFFAADLN